MFNVDWFNIVRDYLTGRTNAALEALFAQVGYNIFEESLPHGYDGQPGIVLSKTPNADHIQNGTDAGIGWLEMISTCYSAKAEDLGDAKALDALLVAALNEVRDDTGEIGTIMLAQVDGFPKSFIDPADTRRAVARRTWRTNVSAATSGV